MKKATKPIESRQKPKQAQQNPTVPNTKPQAPPSEPPQEPVAPANTASFQPITLSEAEIEIVLRRL
jgi:hypothetical protein